MKVQRPQRPGTTQKKSSRGSTGQACGSDDKCDVDWEDIGKEHRMMIERSYESGIPRQVTILGGLTTLGLAIALGARTLIEGIVAFSIGGLLGAIAGPEYGENRELKENPHLYPAHTAYLKRKAGEGRKNGCR